MQNCRVKGALHEPYTPPYTSMSGDVVLDNIMRLIDGKCINKNLQAVNITKEQVLSKTRIEHIVTVRALLIYILRMYGNTVTRIGSYVNRDYTTIIHAINNCKKFHSSKDALFMHYYILISPAFGFKINNN